jgi:hypothetical protein
MNNKTIKKTFLAKIFLGYGFNKTKYRNFTSSYLKMPPLKTLGGF